MGNKQIYQIRIATRGRGYTIKGTIETNEYHEYFTVVLEKAKEYNSNLDDPREYVCIFEFNGKDFVFFRSLDRIYK